MAKKREYGGWIYRWWEGDYEAHEYPIIGYYSRRHWTSKFAHTLVDFYLKHWQWLWATMIAVIALIVTF